MDSNTDPNVLLFRIRSVEARVSKIETKIDAILYSSVATLLGGFAFVTWYVITGVHH